MLNSLSSNWTTVKPSKRIFFPLSTNSWESNFLEIKQNINQCTRDPPLSFSDGNILLRQRHGRHTGSCEYLGLWQLQRKSVEELYTHQHSISETVLKSVITDLFFIFCMRFSLETLTSSFQSSVPHSSVAVLQAPESIEKQINTIEMGRASNWIRDALKQQM